jgi:hypothetical protein
MVLRPLGREYTGPLNSEEFMRSSSFVALMLLAAPLAAQTPAPRAGGWMIRFDRADVSDTSMKVDQMGPGWHVYTTMRGAGVMWRPADVARGNFRVDAETFLFPTSSGHAEGYGLIVGGQNLTAPTQRYLYFLVRADGQFLIKERTGATTRDIVPWTANAAVTRQEGTNNVRENLAIEAAADSVRFFVNGQQVHALARAGLQVDGQVGLRVNHASSVHISRVTVTQR